jgi:hypothetical protein
MSRSTYSSGEGQMSATFAALFAAGQPPVGAACCSLFGAKLEKGI